ncbi:hypothetical protein NMG60_11000537 [Bertholletia excelsa]
MLNQLLSPLPLVLMFLCSSRVLSQPPAQSPVALSPAQPPAAHTTSPKSGPTDITKILEKATHFNTFIRLLKSTQMDNLINDKLNDSSHGITVFAPDDNAFGNLRAGMLNSYNDNQKVQLLRFHMISSFLANPSGFQTASNPVSTEAGSSAYYPLNVTTTGNMVNITTGVVNASVIGTLYSDNQLAVYQVDQVLLPLYFFQSHSPAPARQRLPRKVLQPPYLLQLPCPPQPLVLLILILLRFNHQAQCSGQYPLQGFLRQHCSGLFELRHGQC